MKTLPASTEQCLEVIAEVEIGATTAAACKERSVDPRTFYAALKLDKGLADNYARSKADGIEAYAESIHEIMDETPPEVLTEHGSHVDSGWVAWQRNRVDTRKWILSKRLPKKYGDKLELSGDPEHPIAVAVTEKFDDVLADWRKRYGENRDAK